MTIEYGPDVFSLTLGESIFIDTIFNSSDFNAGGGRNCTYSQPNQSLLTMRIGAPVFTDMSVRGGHSNFLLLLLPKLLLQNLI